MEGEQKITDIPISEFADPGAGGPAPPTTTPHPFSIYTSMSMGVGGAGAKVHPSNLPPSSDKLMYDLWGSQHVAPCVAAAYETGLFAYLDVNPMATVGATAQALGLAPRGVRAVMNVLVGLGLLIRHGEGHVLEGGHSAFLGTDSHFNRAYVFAADTPRDQVERLKTGLATNLAVGVSNPMELWESGMVTPEQATQLCTYFQSLILPAATALARHPIITALGCTSLLDVGGGPATMTIALAQHNVSLTTCTVMDLPSVCSVAESAIVQAGMAGRINVVPCDMFRDPWPINVQADTVMFSNVLHDWDDQQTLFLLQQAYSLLPPGGHVLVHEMLLSEDESGPLTVALMSLHMFLNTKGRQFTYAQMRGMLETVGFVGVGVVSTYSYYLVVYARKM